jgi:hypothetical protein
MDTVYASSGSGSGGASKRAWRRPEVRSLATPNREEKGTTAANEAPGLDRASAKYAAAEFAPEVYSRAYRSLRG